MKKKFLLMIVFLLCLSISICSAEKVISSDRAAIGGITISSDADYIRSIYGEPNQIRKSEDNQNAETWHYGDTFQIDFVDGITSSVVSSGANGLATPDGISVGMKKKSMRSKYGKAHHADKYGKRAIYSYQVDNNANMVFVTRDEIITEIRINRVVNNENN